MHFLSVLNIGLTVLCMFWYGQSELLKHVKHATCDTDIMHYQKPFVNRLILFWATFFIIHHNTFINKHKASKSNAQLYC